MALHQAKTDLERWREHAMTQDTPGRKSLKKKSVSARNLKNSGSQQTDTRSKIVVKKLQETIK